MTNIELIINVLIVVLGVIMGAIAILVYQSGRSKGAKKGKNSDNRFEGMNFVILGDEFPTVTRDIATGLIIKMGGKVENYLSDTTTYALAGNDAGEALNTAKERGITVIDEKEFLKMLL